MLDAMRLAVDKSAEQRRLIAELFDRVVTLERRARIDHNTGIGNRRGVEERLAQEWARSQRYGHALAAIIIDVDGLKRTNDDYGHDAGDELLRAVARRVAELVRTADYVGRIGGDEFVVICPETDAAASAHVALKLVTSVKAKPAMSRGNEIPVSISVGWAVRADQQSPEELLQTADADLYRSRRAVRGIRSRRRSRGRGSGPAV
ncbi:MAG: hypothetical protein NVS3B24_03900 [Candidatus Dormibacteria bacterium]